MQTVQSNLYKEFATVDEARAGLEKYCYFDFEDESEHCRYLTLMLIRECSNIDVLQFFWWFFCIAIRSYYYVDRPKFNKLRACFMRYVLATLVLLKTNVNIANNTVANYPRWWSDCGLYKSAECRKVLENNDFLHRAVTENSG